MNKLQVCTNTDCIKEILDTAREHLNKAEDVEISVVEVEDCQFYAENVEEHKERYEEEEDDDRYSNNS